MDAEINYASQAGLAYWAFCWYRDADPMMNAWRLHQASIHRDRMNWCVLWQFVNVMDGPNLIPQIPHVHRLLSAVELSAGIRRQASFFIFIYNSQMMATSSSKDWANVHNSLDSLRGACTSAGLATPYIVILHAPPSEAQTIMRLVAGDAISNYISCSNAPAYILRCTGLLRSRLLGANGLRGSANGAHLHDRMGSAGKRLSTLSRLMVNRNSEPRCRTRL